MFVAAFGLFALPLSLFAPFHSSFLCDVIVTAFAPPPPPLMREEKRRETPCLSASAELWFVVSCGQRERWVGDWGPTVQNQPRDRKHVWGVGTICMLIMPIYLGQVDAISSSKQDSPDLTNYQA